MTEIAVENKEKATFREGVRGVWRHVRPYKTWLYALGFLGIISALANGAVPYITGRFFDTLIFVAQGESREYAGVPLWLVFLATLAVVQLLANSADWIKDRLRRLLDTTVAFGVETKGFEHLLKLPLSYHVDAHMSGELSKLSRGAWRISSIARIIIDVAPQFLSVLVGIAFAMSINVTLAGILAIGVFIYIVTLIPMLKPIAEADDLAHRAMHDGWNDAAEAVYQVASVKQAASEEFESKKTHEAIMGKAFSLWMKIERTWSNIGGYQRIIVLFTQLAIFMTSINFVASGAITIGELIALNGYAMMFFGPFVSLGYQWQTLQNGLTSAAYIEKMLTAKQEEYHPENAVIPSERSGRVSFENVWFSYRDGKESVLSDMSFNTKTGEVVALVGESGAGKSSTISLISGYYFPNEGSVRVDGVDTHEWDLSELRKRIAVVPQEVALFNDTIRANIRYGSFKATDEQVAEAARQAHLEEFIDSLPDKYKTLVGERGVKLSVGQKQRVAIARAILRDPEILILDEPTSALDSSTEKLITSSLEKLMKGRTTFIIAHRLSTVRKADTILVMDKGRIVEQGSHEKLMQIENGTYRRLYELHIGLHE